MTTHPYPSQVPLKTETSKNRGLFWKPWTRGGVRFGLVVSGVLTAVWTESLSLSSIAVGSLLLLLSMPLQFWSKGCLHQNQSLTKTGPYRFVRHPFYTSGLMLDLGIMVMTGNVWFVVCGIAWWLAVYHHAISQEEIILRRVFGVEYDHYAKHVPALIPWKKPLPVQPYRFDFRSYNIAVTEVPRAIQALVFPLLFLLALWIDRPGFDLNLANSVVALWLLASVLSLFACARIWRQSFKTGAAVLPDAAAQPAARTIYVFAIVVAGLVWSQFDPAVDPWLHRLPGIVLLALALLLTFGPHKARLLAESGIAMGLAILLELEWVAVLLLPLYLSVIIIQWRASEGESNLLTEDAMSGPSLLTLAGLGLAVLMVCEMLV
jgi:protein-S-isoprenylcysteine O-methyltransferase Ste14